MLKDIFKHLEFKLSRRGKKLGWVFSVKFRLNLAEKTAELSFCNDSNITFLSELIVLSQLFKQSMLHDKLVRNPTLLHVQALFVSSFKFDESTENSNSLTLCIIHMNLFMIFLPRRCKSMNIQNNMLFS